MSDDDMSSISGDALRIDDAPKVFADVDNPADVASDANATGDTMAGDPFAGLQPDTSMDFGGVPDDQDSVRTAHGHTEFLTGIHHDRDHGKDRWALPPDIAAGIPRKRRPVSVESMTVAADGVALTLITLGAPPNGQKVVYERENRVRVVITNYGPNTLWVSGDSGYIQGSTNGVQIAVGASREFRTSAELWAGSFGAGTQLDVQDEFYLP